jgi:hypothetical protein
MGSRIALAQKRLPSLRTSPALRLEAPFRQRDLQGALRQAGYLILGREENREILADDFVGSVALEPFGSRVPRRDPARSVEHVDCIVRDRIDEQLEPLLLGEILDARQLPAILTLRRNAPILSRPRAGHILCIFPRSNPFCPRFCLRTG